MSNTLHCFTAYDVRGRIPEELNEDVAARIALAFCSHFGISKVVIGRDMRLSSPGLAESVIRTLTSQGIDVVDIGLSGTEEMYHAVFSGQEEGIGGGIEVTASHNPADYNGMKFVCQGARPVSDDSGLQEIAEMAASEEWYRDQVRNRPAGKGTHYQVPDKDRYIAHLLSYVEPGKLRPLKLVVNSGNGCAGPVIDQLAPHLPMTFIRLHHEPDGTFPHGVPNPLLPENRQETADMVRLHNADLGIAWDGDFDRCFFYDETGRFIEGYYIVGLLARAMLRLHPGATILHDPRLIWNTRDIVQEEGGRPVMTRTGHAFIKEAMRRENAVYGGEMSAHHYFRDFGYCDSGMVPWLLVCRLLSEQDTPLSAMVNDCINSYPVSGEINSTVDDPDAVLERIEARFSDGKKDYTDGLSVAYSDFRFNVRKSNTEPVLRLNVETRGDKLLLQQKTGELLELIRQN